MERRSGESSYYSYAVTAAYSLVLILVDHGYFKTPLLYDGPHVIGWAISPTAQNSSNLPLPRNSLSAVLKNVAAILGWEISKSTAAGYLDEITFNKHKRENIIFIKGWFI